MQSFFHSTEKKSLNQQTGADGVQTILAPTQSKTKGRRWYVSVNGSVKANLCTVLKKKTELVRLTGLGEVSAKSGVREVNIYAMKEIKWRMKSADLVEFTEGETS